MTIAQLEMVWSIHGSGRVGTGRVHAWIGSIHGSDRVWSDRVKISRCKFNFTEFHLVWLSRTGFLIVVA